MIMFQNFFQISDILGSDVKTSDVIHWGKVGRICFDIRPPSPLLDCVTLGTISRRCGNLYDSKAVLISLKMDCLRVLKIIP